MVYQYKLVPGTSTGGIPAEVGSFFWESFAGLQVV